MRNYCRLFFIICILLPVFASAHQVHFKIVDRSNQNLKVTSNDNEIMKKLAGGVGKISPMSSYSILFNMPVSSSSNNGVWINIEAPNGIAEKLDFRMESRASNSNQAKLMFDNQQPFSMVLDSLDNTNLTTTADKTTVKWDPENNTPVITVYYPGVQAISYDKVNSKTNILQDVKKLLWLSDSYEEKQDNSRYALALAFKAYQTSLKVMQIASDQNDDYTQPSVAALKDYSHIIFDIGAQLTAKHSGDDNWSIFFKKIDNFIQMFIQTNKLQDKKIICLIDKSKLSANSHYLELNRTLHILKTRLKIKSMEIAYIESQATYQDLKNALNISIKDYNVTNEGLKQQKDRNKQMAQSNVTSMQQEIAEITHQISHAEIGNKKSELDFQQNALDKTATESNITTLEADKDKIEEGLKNIKLESLQQQLGTQQAIVNDADEDAEKKETAGFTVQGIEAQIDKKTEEKNRLTSQLEEVNQKLTDKQSELETLGNQKSEIDQKMRENQTNILSHQKALLEKQQELSTLETKLKQVELA